MNKVELRKIPVIINNFNRVDSLKKLIKWLEMQKMENIYVIDNVSTYEPLKKYYENEFKYNLIKLRKNTGSLSIWLLDIYDNFKENYYIYTDSDVILIEDCPENWLEKFYEILNKHQEIDKIGFGLKIDDLPDEYSLKKEVIRHE